jgi:peptidoglycan/xylan/chitin deacetylase (PgdA/CDA1 family)
MFHSVGDGAFENLTPTAFRELLSRLNDSVTFVDLPEIFETQAPERRIPLTFDNGYRGFHDHVVPILNEYEAPVTVFAVAGTLRQESLSVDEHVDGNYMSPAQLTAVADDELVSIGNHTMTHTNLQAVESSQRLHEEIVEAKTVLEDELGVPVDRFCYPYNNVSREVVSVVKDSHKWAVCGGGWEARLSMATNPYLIPRVNGAKQWWRVRWHLLDRGTHLARGADELQSFVACILGQTP